MTDKAQEPLTAQERQYDIPPPPSLDHYIKELLGVSGVPSLLAWPPDLFAITSMALSHSGLYTRAIDLMDWVPWAPETNAHHVGDKLWHEEVYDEGRAFYEHVETHLQGDGSPALIATIPWFDKCVAHAKSLSHHVEQFYEMRGGRPAPATANAPATCLHSFWEQEIEEPLSSSALSQFLAINELLTLHAIADEACGYILGRGRQNALHPAIHSRRLAFDALGNSGSLATIANTICRVLPKNHTPRVGLTLRTFSANVGFHRSSVDVRWHSPRPDSDIPPAKDTINVLLLPWPATIRAQDFRPVGRGELFAFAPRFAIDRPLQALRELHGALLDAIASAKQEAGVVDFLVMPECALTPIAAELVDRVARKAGIALSILGVHEGGANDMLCPLGRNYIRTTLYGQGAQYSTNAEATDHVVQQDKHHRWRLDESQIGQYQLGSVLSSARGNWWEGIRVRRRSVSFIDLAGGLTLSSLLCEDLARQDPMADLMRTVGCSLVVCLLMDGPQLRSRWSARYASILADDPGSSVLTLTSYGLLRRTHTLTSHAPSRAVALWKDGTGRIEEIELRKNTTGILLSLTKQQATDVMADGREEAGHRLVLTGVVNVGREGGYRTRGRQTDPDCHGRRQT